MSLLHRRMSTCRWCTPGGPFTAELLKSYAANDLGNDFDSANDDLSYCMECVVEYHKARDEAPQFHKVVINLKEEKCDNHMKIANYLGPVIGNRVCSTLFDVEASPRHYDII